MSWFDLFRLAADIITLIVAVAAGVGGLMYVLRSRQNQILQEDNNSCSKKLEEHSRLIATLRGELNVVKELPLQQIANSLLKLDDIAKSNDEIVTALQNSSRIEATKIGDKVAA